MGPMYSIGLGDRQHCFSRGVYNPFIFNELEAGGGGVERYTPTHST